MASKRPAKAAKAKKPAGRPSKFTPAIMEAIFQRVSHGEPLAAICREDGMPGLRTVYDWLEGDALLSARFARAREAGYDMIAQDALRIADTPAEGVVEKHEMVKIENPDNPGGPAVEELRLVERRVEDMLGHRKLQVETRLKLLAKWDPKRYGDRVALEHAGPNGGPIQTITSQMSPQEAAAAYAATLKDS